MSKRVFALLVLIVSAMLSLAACASMATPPAGNGGAAGTAGPDSDGDNIPDSAEVVLGTDPNNPDTDGDGQDDLADAAPLSAANPINEGSTTVGFTIDSIAVENNVNASGADVPDHLELTISNTTQSDIGDFDIYYTLTDSVTGAVQSFYQSLPGFTLKAGEKTQLHFDTTGQPGHFRADPNSMFYTGQNALTVDVVLHAAGFAPQTVSVHKDSPSSEAGGD
jgi:hypothetical protein